MLTIDYANQDITTVERGIIGHGVNCQLKMGSGVALAIKTKWPAVYNKYITGPSGPAALGLAEFVFINPQLYVANMYTQEYYGYDGAKYASTDAITDSFKMVVTCAKQWDLPIYIPKIGSALGGLDWEADVITALNKAIEDVDYDVNLTVCVYGE